ncbi:DUF4397 domain-containing protein [Modestobacter sp. VKM Ac-2986]|uniref:DUF4397 domain-containing protein n=1 Tax=Modestobacter sp. VKM Ac-2986 TaxID=3004140 RepID=UPI0022AB7E4D|nr:DUF4397 domain-containing protein [Modestobacter sp. VKM Ac-2986]MCZ2829560.1 DUF4397 domain-containing protein [Modestobacter sp. VKM Ac-2986]
MARLTRVPLLALLCAGLCALGLPAASAAPAVGADTGLVRMMHLSPDTPSVDAYIDSVSAPGTGVVLSGVSYGDVSAYQTVPAGTYTVSARGAGADPSSPPVLATTVTVTGGTATTIAGVGYFAELGFAVLPDDLTLPAAGQARARVINAAATASPVDLSLGTDTTLARGLSFADSTDYVDVPGGAETLKVVPGNGTPSDLPVDLAAGSVYTVLVLDRSGGLAVSTELDAASPGVVPVGGVEAGAGGAADGGVPAGPLALAGVAVGLLLLTARTRLPRRGHEPRHLAA